MKYWSDIHTCAAAGPGSDRKDCFCVFCCFLSNFRWLKDFWRFINSYLVHKHPVHIQISPHELKETSRTLKGLSDKCVGAEISKRRRKTSAGGRLKSCSETLSEWAFIMKEKDQQDFHNKVVVRESESSNFFLSHQIAAWFRGTSAAGFDPHFSVCLWGAPWFNTAQPKVCGQHWLGVAKHLASCCLLKRKLSVFICCVQKWCDADDIMKCSLFRWRRGFFRANQRLMTCFIL